MKSMMTNLLTSIFLILLSTQSIFAITKTEIVIKNYNVDTPVGSISKYMISNKWSDVPRSVKSDNGYAVTGVEIEVFVGVKTNDEGNSEAEYEDIIDIKFTDYENGLSCNPESYLNGLFLTAEAYNNKVIISVPVDFKIKDCDELINSVRIL